MSDSDDSGDEQRDQNAVKDFTDNQVIFLSFGCYFHLNFMSIYEVMMRQTDKTNRQMKIQKEISCLRSKVALFCCHSIVV